MKLLGIDYGSKRVGIATAEEAGMAFPKSVIPNDSRLIESIREICEKENISKIILGDSRNLDGTDNKITQEIQEFKLSLEDKLKIEVILEPEFYTTYQASRIQGDSEMIDASAATIILQSYIDRMKNK